MDLAWDMMIMLLHLPHSLLRQELCQLGSLTHYTPACKLLHLKDRHFGNCSLIIMKGGICKFIITQYGCPQDFFLPYTKFTHGLLWNGRKGHGQATRGSHVGYHKQPRAIIDGTPLHIGWENLRKLDPKSTCSDVFGHTSLTNCRNFQNFKSQLQGPITSISLSTHTDPMLMGR